MRMENIEPKTMGEGGNLSHFGFLIFPAPIR